jgi:hypothetical protein
MIEMMLIIIWLGHKSCGIMRSALGEASRTVGRN